MNESSTEQAERSFALRQRIAIGIFPVFILVFVLFTIKMVKLERTAPAYGLVFQVIALWGVMTALLVFMIALLLHRKWKTGRFILTRAEMLAKQDEVWNKLGAGKPFGPQAKYYAVVAVFAAVLLSFAAFPIALLKSGCFTRPTTPLVILFATILFLPGWLLFKMIRRKVKTGSVLPSQEEIAKARARSRKPASLWSRIVAANVMAPNAGLWTSGLIRDHIRHRTPEDFSWLLTIFWWFFTAFWMSQVFRPIKPLAVIPDTPDEPQKIPVNRFKLIALGLVLPLILASIFPLLTTLTVHPIPVIYPPATQAKADLAAALQSAAQNHKRILLDFGASWCPDCQTLDRYDRDPVNAALLQSSFVLVRVNMESEDRQCNANEDLAHQYQVPLDKGIPALAVLSDKGELIYSQRNGEFEGMRHLKSSDLTAFLQRWKP